MTPKVYADFNNADAKGRLRLNCNGTREDLTRNGIDLRAGLMLLFCSDDVDPQGRPMELQVPGIVEFSDEERSWVGVIDWSAIQRVSPETLGANLALLAPEVRAAFPTDEAVNDALRSLIQQKR